MKTTAFLLACIFIAFALPCQAGAEQVESLFGLATDAEAKTVSIMVSSSGCTDKGYFSFALEGDVLIFKRIRRDACKAVPGRHAITYSLEELGIKPDSAFRIGNPITLTENVF
jgi:hypothetical protein